MDNGMHAMGTTGYLSLPKMGDALHSQATKLSYMQTQG